MSRRSKDWDEYFRKEFKNKEFAQAFIEELMESEDLSIKEAMTRVVYTYGLQEYAELTGVSEASISRALNRGGDLSLDMLRKLLAPVGLKPKISVQMVAGKTRPEKSRPKAPSAEARARASRTGKTGQHAGAGS